MLHLEHFVNRGLEDPIINIKPEAQGGPQLAAEGRLAEAPRGAANDQTENDLALSVALKEAAIGSGVVLAA